jgi:2-polyprenyl-3-methyl-5-hydroxy-6-metoxy-1,4-benzoquinol methylase
MSKKLKGFFPAQSGLSILDVGSGHGPFPYMAMKQFPSSNHHVDIIDISHVSLERTKKILVDIGGGNTCISMHLADIFDFHTELKYDLIFLGEILEHLDNPRLILTKLSSFLSETGILWFTVPTNSPALDHVYLFSSRSEVIALIEKSELSVIESINFCSEDVDETTSTLNRITSIVAGICRKKT